MRNTAFIFVINYSYTQTLKYQFQNLHNSFRCSSYLNIYIIQHSLEKS